MHVRTWPKAGVGLPDIYVRAELLRTELPIGISVLATIHFLYPKLGSFSDMEYYLYQLAYRDSNVTKRFVGLIQMQCSFDCNWDKQNNTHNNNRFYSKLPTRFGGRDH